MPATTTNYVDQIVQKYVVFSKLKAKLEEKCGKGNFKIVRQGIMDTRSRPKSRTREAANIRDRIKEGLQDLRRRYPDGKIYVSEYDLSKWVTPDAVGKWIVASRIEEVDSLHLKNQICSSALKTFCVLLEIEKENTIRYFIEKADPKDGADRSSFAVAEDVQRFLAYGCSPWTPAKCQEFCETWRKYVAARLSYGKIRRLGDKEILPFRREEVFDRRADATLYKVDFDGRFLIDKPGKPYSDDMILMMMKELPLEVAQKEHHLMQYLQARQDEPNPHLIELYAYYTQRKKGFLLMPLLQGDLGDFLKKDARKEPFQSDECYLGGMLSLAKALCSMHTIDKGLYNETMIHHDLKPANVLLDNGKFVLSDFGIGSIRCPTVGPDQESYGHSSWWLAPETEWDGPWRGSAGLKSDVFSLGCIFLELLVHMRGGKEAVSDFRRDRSARSPTEAARFWDYCKENNQPRISAVVLSELEGIMRDAGHSRRARVAGVVLQMLAMEPRSRLSAKEVLTDLQDILEEPDSEMIPEADAPLVEQTPYQERRNKDQGTGAKTPSSAVEKAPPTLAEPSGHGVTDPTSKKTFTVAEATAKLGHACNHECNIQFCLRTKNLSIPQQGRIKSEWKTEPYISGWAGKATSSVLFLYSDNDDDEEVLSYLCSRIVNSAKGKRPSDGTSATVLRHLCRQNSRNGELAVYQMMQCLLRQLLSTWPGSDILQSPSDAYLFSDNDCESLQSMFESRIEMLPSNMQILCVIDGLQAYCDRGDRQKRRGRVKEFLLCLVKLASVSQVIRCRFKLLLTASRKPLAIGLSEACDIHPKDRPNLGNEAMDLQGLKDRFWTDNKLRWA
ncbi:MAG: hypothetical protein Q9207_007563 [Kuettlingeria erythrocarpa]